MTHPVIPLGGEESSLDIRAESVGKITSAVAVSSETKDGAVYGIIDPDYGRAYTIIRTLAWQQGYAIGLHGSFTRDLDLIAVPWSEQCSGRDDHLVARIVAATGLKLLDGTPRDKPHGRRAYSLLFPAFGDPRWVDLSVMPRAAPTDKKMEGQT